MDCVKNAILDASNVMVLIMKIVLYAMMAFILIILHNYVKYAIMVVKSVQIMFAKHAL